MSKTEESLPFVSLGKELKALRAKSKESLAEVSGAVEIDVMELVSFENGQKKPSEDILLLLISHFGAQGEQAVQLWEMAGYSLFKVEPTAQELPILYTDTADVTASQNGVSITFAHINYSNLGVSPLAKLGMSREHAKRLAEAIRKTLEKTEKPDSKTPRN